MKQNGGKMVLSEGWLLKVAFFAIQRLLYIEYIFKGKKVLCKIARILLSIRQKKTSFHRHKKLEVSDIKRMQI
jgi:hypothetical protein